MTYACPAWEFAADTHLLKLQRLQNKVLRTIGHFPRRTPVRDLHVAFRIPYMYDFITKLCRQQAEGIQNYRNENVRNIGKAKPNTENIRGLNLAALKATTVQVTKLPM
jgi:hypothetical protein